MGKTCDSPSVWMSPAAVHAPMPNTARACWLAPSGPEAAPLLPALFASTMMVSGAACRVRVLLSSVQLAIICPSLAILPLV